jgi:hypothetical protein
VRWLRALPGFLGPRDATRHTWPHRTTRASRRLSKRALEPVNSPIFGRGPREPLPRSSPAPKARRPAQSRRAPRSRCSGARGRWSSRGSPGSARRVRRWFRRRGGPFDGALGAEARPLAGRDPRAPTESTRHVPSAQASTIARISPLLQRAVGTGLRMPRGGVRTVVRICAPRVHQ